MLPARSKERREVTREDLVLHPTFSAEDMERGEGAELTLWYTTT
jgi:hypothetical protein